MKEKIFMSPSRYIQGTHVIEEIPKYISGLGERLLLVTSAGNMVRLKDQIDNVLNQEDYTAMAEAFNGECTMAEIERICGICRENDIDVIAGLGGGKVIDTVKAVSHFVGLRLVVVPTTASSDAPCSALSIIYKEDGNLDQLLHLKANPDIVLVDVAVIAKAPAHLLAAGIGDAMATYFEMKESFAKDNDSFNGGRITLAAKAIAEQCYETIMADGYQAYLSAQCGAVTRALENVVEANTLLSGIGFESGGITAAHPINNGLAEMEETHSLMHGEKVSFALMCQLLLAGEPKETIDKVADLFIKVGLPITLKELGLENISDERLHMIAQIALSDPFMGNLPVRADEESVVGAILLADKVGQIYLAG